MLCICLVISDIDCNLAYFCQSGGAGHKQTCRCAVRVTQFCSWTPTSFVGEPSSTGYSSWQRLRDLWHTGFFYFLFFIFISWSICKCWWTFIHPERWGKRLEPSNYQQRQFNFTFEWGPAAKFRNICLHRLLLLAIVLTGSLVNSAWVKDNTVFFCSLQKMWADSVNKNYVKLENSWRNKITCRWYRWKRKAFKTHDKKCQLWRRPTNYVIQHFVNQHFTRLNLCINSN